MPRPTSFLRRTLAPALAAAAFLLVPGFAGAQGFTAVHSRDGVDVWAVGDAGAWARSFDGGVTWTSGTLTTARTLRGVAQQGTTVLVVADSGQVYRSVDNGSSWARTVVAGTPDLHAVEMPAAGVAVIAGGNGTLLRSSDGGATWAPQGPGGAATLYGLRMTSDLAGWAVGGGGRVLHTVDGGENWVPVAAPTTLDLLAVDAVGSRVWVVGASGVALKSANDGGLWTPVNLRMDLPGEVRAVTLSGGAGVTLTGGGGFIRSSADDGATWTFATHPLIAATSDYFAYGANLAWVTAGRTRAVIRTTNGGTSWSLPSGTTTTWDWQLKQLAGNVTVRGNTFATTPQNRNSVWCAMGQFVFKSLNRGETWTQIATILPATVVKTNSFYVSAKDSNLWVAACGTPDQIARSTNAGATWTTSLAKDFTEYGMPLEMNPDRPDTLLFAPEDGRVYRSPNFGASWDTLANAGFRSPCDIVISPDNDQNVVVGDGVTGVGLAKIWQSTNGGVSFLDRYTGASSEVPTVWSSRLGNNALFAANWSSGGVWRSLNFGQTWAQVTTVTSAWGGATANDDPKLVTFNRYAGSPNYVSTDGGTTFTSSVLTNPGSGYSLNCLDRSTILDMHSGGIYKLNMVYAVPPAAAAALTVTSPDGGESWAVGSVHAVTWTALNVPWVAIEWRASPAGPWQPVGEAEGAAGTFAWTVPAAPTTQAQVRVRDAADGSPEDLSNATFTIAGEPQLAVSPSPYDFGLVPVGYAQWDTLHVENPGTGPVSVSAITSDNARFRVTRTAFVLGAGAGDTLAVWFTPTSAGADSALFTFLTDDAGSPHQLRVRGAGGVAVGVGDVPLAFALERPRPNPFSDETSIRFTLPAATHVTLEVFDLAGRRVAVLADGLRDAGVHAVSFRPRASADGGRGAGLRSGVFFVRLSAGPLVRTQKILYMAP